MRFSLAIKHLNMVSICFLKKTYHRVSVVLVVASVGFAVTATVGTDVGFVVAVAGDDVGFVVAVAVGDDVGLKVRVTVGVGVVGTVGLAVDGETRPVVGTSDVGLLVGRREGLLFVGFALAGMMAGGVGEPPQSSEIL